MACQEKLDMNQWLDKLMVFTTSKKMVARTMQGTYDHFRDTPSLAD
jgi:hypothetical protein